MTAAAWTRKDTGAEKRCRGSQALRAFPLKGGDGPSPHLPFRPLRLASFLRCSLVLGCPPMILCRLTLGPLHLGICMTWSAQLAGAPRGTVPSASLASWAQGPTSWTVYSRCLLFAQGMEAQAMSEWDLWWFSGVDMQVGSWLRGWRQLVPWPGEGPARLNKGRPPVSHGARWPVSVCPPSVYSGHRLYCPREQPALSGGHRCPRQRDVLRKAGFFFCRMWTPWALGRTSTPAGI